MQFIAIKTIRGCKYGYLRRDDPIRCQWQLFTGTWLSSSHYQHLWFDILYYIWCDKHSMLFFAYCGVTLTRFWTSGWVLLSKHGHEIKHEKFDIYTINYTMRWCNGKEINEKSMPCLNLDNWHRGTRIEI